MMLFASTKAKNRISFFARCFFIGFPVISALYLQIPVQKIFRLRIRDHKIFYCTEKYPRCSLSITVDMGDPINVESYEDFDDNVVNLQSNFLTIHNSSTPKDNFTQQVIYSDFPDAGYLPLIASLYTLNMPDYIFYVNTSYVNSMPSTAWLEDAISQFCHNDYDILFGGQTTYKGVKVGIGIAIIRSTLVRELLYYTNSTYFSIPPLLSLSLISSRNSAIRIVYYPFDGIKSSSNYDYITNPQIPQYRMCPNINDPPNPTIALLLPQFKRKYIYNFIENFEKQTLLPEFYCIVQCENRITLDLSLIRKKSSRPVYHIWGYNWSPLFLFPVYVSSFFPVDFVMRWDDDQTPKDINHQRYFVDEIKNKNKLIGTNGKSYTEISSKVYGMKTKSKCDEKDHISVPLMYRPMHAKVAARLRPYSLAQGEDMTLCISSSLVCNATTIKKRYNFKTYQYDWNKQALDRKLNKLPENKKGTLINNIYDYFIEKADYVPICFENVTKKDAYKKIEFAHSEFYKQSNYI
ncbi:hypothetical protein GPJ56_010095 [Histomonas meleagridis]|uniref:uncharacterized protein n=1 Tax=Histomonas meleagridis TaxID=135588 RepID=UPI00355A7EC1|nr:hypothetical protein GPJ56_010095 [Histomonas meleagridis]KAH0806751.1 hypothetical protein GO595_000394 [Histomonas meleagridis]